MAQEHNDDLVRSLTERRRVLFDKWGGLRRNPAALHPVAELIGVSPPTLWRWENGKTRPHRMFLATWSRVIGELEVSKQSLAGVGRRWKAREAN